MLAEKMKKRIVIPIAILATALLIGLYLPVDLVRRPIGTSVVSMPVHAETLSCYTLSNGKRIPFDGNSHFGKFWAWRRGLNSYNNIDIGPSDTELEKMADNPHTGYLIFLSDSVTNAITYSRAAGWTSGAILGEINQFGKNNSGQWQLIGSYRDSSNSLHESFFRMKISVVTIVLGIIAAIGISIRANKQNKSYAKDRQHAPPAGRGEAPRP